MTINKGFSGNKALIAGAGVGGLTLALALARQGIAVKLLEQAPEQSAGGVGIQLSPNATSLLESLGVSHALNSHAVEPLNAYVLNEKNKLLFSTSLKGAYAAPYLHLHRADLISVLKEAALASGVELHQGRVIRYSQDENAITLETQEGKSYSADIAVGADGIHSAMRAQMVKTAPRFRGQVAWRGLVPAEKLPENLLETSAYVWAGSGRHFVAYYVLHQGKRFVNFVAVQNRKTLTEENWNKEGDLNELRQAFVESAEPVRAILAATNACFVWGLFDSKPLRSWANKRAVLLGDACHPTLPFLAQGAAMAIEDAFVLARTLAKEASIQTAFKRYYQLRFPRASKIQALSRRQGWLYHAHPFLARLAFSLGSWFNPLDRVYKGITQEGL